MSDDEAALLRSVAIQNANAIMTARQRAEDELRHTKESLERKTEELDGLLSAMRATLESTTDGILVTDTTGKITAFNERYVTMSGLSAADMTAEDHRSVRAIVAHRFVDPQAFVTRIDEIYASSPAESFDVLETRDGRAMERTSRLQVVGTRAVGRVWSFRDVTEQRRAEEERTQLLDRERMARAQAERMSEMKDEFLATLSHELRTPLGAILGWAQVLRRGVRSDADLQHGLDIIERNARAQTQLIEDLLDMSRITAGKVRLDVQSFLPMGAIEAAIETVRLAAEAKEIRLVKVLDPTAGPIAGDPGRLQQVVWNLLSNAIKFTPRGGRVQVVLERVNSHIDISVVDDGAGIAPSFITHVFDRFRQADASMTRQHGGLGLGLAIVKQLVELHGGTVQAGSAGVGQGATFTVTLPVPAVYRAARATERVHPTTTQWTAEDVGVPDLGGATVLVVDDEIDTRELIARVLSDCQARVLVAGSAVEALAIIERERPDVLVSDLGMPEVDGFELLRRVRALGAERGGQVPAIALTAFARSEDRTRTLRAGFLQHLAKPVQYAELVASVASVARGVLSQRSGGAS